MLRAIRTDRPGWCRFEFDLGGRLVTGPQGAERIEHWTLYQPDERVLTYWSDGSLQLTPLHDPMG